MSDHERAEVRRAGLIYLVTTHAATLLLFVAFALWARGAPDWTFASLAATGPGDAASRGGLLVLVLVAFGVKAGIVPLHFWLPGAHAAAPSHVSAAMSGLVIKTGIYGLFRVLALTGSPPAWWGWTVLTLGVASAVLGVLWALAQHDIKRLLAYHSVENIGIILMGMGVGALGSANGNAALATLGYGAALLHTVNHALFKALLFLSAGAVYRATGTRNIEDLGGLGRLMPLTWGAFLVGAAAIIGVPPLNGFVSEWLVFQGLLATGRGAGGLGLALLGVPALALVGGLALACFAKAAGVMFLGNARSDRARGAREMPADFTAPALALAAACIAIGVLAGVVVPPLMGVGASLAGGPALLTDPLVAGTVGGAQRVSVFAFVLLATGGALALLRRALVGREPVRTEGTWACGYTATSPRMQYTASSFAAPLIAVFGRLSGVTEQRGATLFHSTPRDLVLDGVALPAWTRVQRAALRLRPMQQGRLHIYVLYVVATLVALLAWLVVTPGAAP